MGYSEHSDDVLVFDPYYIRPGTVCDVDITYSVKYETVWNSNSQLQYTVSGLITRIDSVKSDDYEIPLNLIHIDLQEDGSYKVVIEPIYKGIIDLYIFYYEKVSVSVATKAAFNSSYSTYYKDYMKINDAIVPKTVLELPTIEGSYKIIHVDVDPNVVDNGITYFGDKLVSIKSNGLLEYNGGYEYILKRGREQVKIPLDSDLESIRVDGDKKVIEIDNLEWKSGYTEARGIITYDDKLLALTNKSLCLFSMYSDMETPILEDENIVGYDLTLTKDDCILVSGGDRVYKYKVRHNNVWINKQDGKIYFREKKVFIIIKNN